MGVPSAAITCTVGASYCTSAANSMSISRSSRSYSTFLMTAAPSSGTVKLPETEV